MVTEQISLFAFYGARVILGVLVVLSFFTLGFFIERMLFFKKRLLKHSKLLLMELEGADTIEDMKYVLEEYDSAETEVVLRALNSNTAPGKELIQKG